MELPRSRPFHATWAQAGWPVDDLWDSAAKGVHEVRGALAMAISGSEERKMLRTSRAMTAEDAARYPEFADTTPDVRRSTAES